MRRIVSCIMSSLFLVGMLALAVNACAVEPVQTPTVYINSDGSISPSSAPISTVDNVTYTFTGNMSYPAYNGIVVERNNIIIDGNGYTVQGPNNSQGTCLNLTSISNVIIENANVQGFYYGIYLYFCASNSINGNNIANNDRGIYLYFCTSNSISGNNIANNEAGIVLDSSGDISVSGNNITANNEAGIDLDVSSSNFISGNNIANNERGLVLTFSSDNEIYHNNFINNTSQMSTLQSANACDDGYPSGGNYWSDYNGTDLYSGPGQNLTGSDGIGDTPYVIDANNTDHYPLMGMCYEFFPSFFSNRTVSVTVISNSTVSDLIYAIWLSTPYDGLQPGQPFIEYLTSGQSGSTGFCRVTIPRTILNASSYTVWVDYNRVNATELPTSNSTNAYLYFTYPLPTQQVIITIPEFASFTLLSLFTTITLLGTLILKRKRNRRTQPAAKP